MSEITQFLVVEQELRRGSVADHASRAAELAPDKLEHLANRIGDCAGAAARVEQTHGARTGGHVLNHQRARVTAVQKAVATVANDNLAGERLGKSHPTRA